jgi:hypothetical protein
VEDVTQKLKGLNNYCMVLELLYMTRKTGILEIIFIPKDKTNIKKTFKGIVHSRKTVFDDYFRQVKNEKLNNSENKKQNEYLKIFEKLYEICTERYYKQTSEEKMTILTYKCRELETECLKRIYEKLSYLLNLTQSQKMDPIMLLNHILEICRMYKVPSLYKYLFRTTLPNVMRLNVCGTDSILTLLYKVANSLTDNLKSQTFMNLFSRDVHENNIFHVNSDLFSTIYEDAFDFDYKKDKPLNRSNRVCTLKNFTDNNTYLSEVLQITSPSTFYKFPFTYKLEGSVSKCLDFFVECLHNFLPFLVLMTKDLDVIIVLFRMLLDIDQDSVKKLSLNTFCRFNLAYLDLWQIFNKVELDPDEDDWFAETPDPDAS